MILSQSYEFTDCFQAGCELRIGLDLLLMTEVDRYARKSGVAARKSVVRSHLPIIFRGRLLVWERKLVTRQIWKWKQRS